jgi:hypothetical protein
VGISSTELKPLQEVSASAITKVAFVLSGKKIALSMLNDIILQKKAG